MQRLFSLLAVLWTLFLASSLQSYSALPTEAPLTDVPAAPPIVRIYDPQRDTYDPHAHTIVPKNAEDPSLLHVRYATELPGPICRHVERFIIRERSLRSPGGTGNEPRISKRINIVQVAFHALYTDEADNLIFEHGDLQKEDNRKALFYLSRTAPARAQRQLDAEQQRETNIDRRTLEFIFEGFREAILIQRQQPLLESAYPTVKYFQEPQWWCSRPDLYEASADEARRKAEAIDSLIDRCRHIIRELRRISPLPREEGEGLQEKLHFTQRLWGDFCKCLEWRDFAFDFLAGSLRNYPPAKDFIRQIRTRLSGLAPLAPALVVSEDAVDHEFKNVLFNSDLFNLWCSEQLILYEKLSNPNFRGKLISDFAERFQERKEAGKALRTFWFHLHSTRTPCKACLVSISEHLRVGWIRAFFTELREFFESEEIRDVSIRFIISYHEPHQGRYDCHIPLVSGERDDWENLIIFSQAPLNPTIL